MTAIIMPMPITPPTTPPTIAGVLLLRFFVLVLAAVEGVDVSVDVGVAAREDSVPFRLYASFGLKSL